MRIKFPDFFLLSLKFFVYVCVSENVKFLHFEHGQFQCRSKNHRFWFAFVYHKALLARIPYAVGLVSQQNFVVKSESGCNIFVVAIGGAFKMSDFFVRISFKVITKLINTTVHNQFISKSLKNSNSKAAFVNWHKPQVLSCDPFFSLLLLFQMKVL